MIELTVYDRLDAGQFREVAALWEAASIANPARGDDLQSVNRTLEHSGRVILARSGELAAGTLWLTHDFRRLYIHHMAVHPDFQNRGCGRLLLERALAIASELKLQAKLEVHRDNASARALYASVGFELLAGYETMIKRDT